MLLYTLVVKENNTFNLLGSTFESDVAIYLYYKNKEEYENIFFLWSEVKYTYFNNFVIDEFLEDNTIYFLGKMKDGYLSELLFEDNLNIFRLTSEYISNESLCLEINDFNDYCNIIKKHSHKKNEILPPNYEKQDIEYLHELAFYNDSILEDIFIDELEYDVLFIGIIEYIKDGYKYLVTTGCGYEEQAVAFQLNEYINELETNIKYDYYFKPLFIPKEKFKDYLDNDKIKLIVINEKDAENKKIEFNILEKGEKTDKLTIDCYHSLINNIQITMYNDFIDNKWDKYSKDFEEEFLEDDCENINKEDIINTYIEYINSSYLKNNNNWFESIQLMLSASKIEDITFIMDCELKEEHSIFQKNIHSAFIFLKECFEGAVMEDFFEELGIVLMLKQKSNIKRNNGDSQHRIGAFFLCADGVNSLTAEETKEYVNSTEMKLNSKNITYIDGKKMLKILNIESTFIKK